MVADAKTVYTQFQKRELISIAQEMDLTVDIGTRASDIVAAIYADIEENGVPDTSDESLSDTLLEFLVAAEYIDENGNVIGEEDEQEISDDELPTCFTYADERDPSCQKCRVFDKCMAERVKSRPKCFGKLYKSTDEQCAACLEALPCSLIVIKIQKQQKEQ